MADEQKQKEQAPENPETLEADETSQGVEMDFDSMSDEEFLNQAFSAEVQAGPDPEEPTPDRSGGVLEDRLGPPPSQEGQPEEPGEADDAEQKPEEASQEESGEAEPKKEADPVDAQKAKSGNEKADGDVEPGTVKDSSEQTTPKQSKESGEEKTSEETAEAPDYENLYKQIMAPFKANGREFAPASPEEVVRLMQMGANYTKKMQALKPNLRLMRMLENNNLLDEEKINFLIDLDQKNPEAITKLLQDGKIDPLDLDTTKESNYQPSNQKVSDAEMAFQDVVTDVGSTDQGRETIRHVNDTWDHASKQVIYQEPQVLAIIHEQRANGIYDQISAEIDRQRTLGNLENVPFIQAYKMVGDRLQAEGKFGQVAQSQGQQTQQQPQTTAQSPQTQRQVLETRPETRRKPMTNGDKAKAASPAPTAPKSKRQEFDPFAMSDEEILSITTNRF